MVFVEGQEWPELPKENMDSDASGCCCTNYTASPRPLPTQRLYNNQYRYQLHVAGNATQIQDLDPSANHPVLCQPTTSTLMTSSSWQLPPYAAAQRSQPLQTAACMSLPNADLNNTDQRDTSQHHCSGKNTVQDIQTPITGPTNRENSYVTRLPTLIQHVRCCTDASLPPDQPHQNPRVAGIAILFVNPQVQPAQTIYIKARSSWRRQQLWLSLSSSTASSTSTIPASFRIANN
jgi:hypothetical protein